MLSRTALVVVCLLLMGISAASAADHPRGRPNIVVILADDLGYTDLGVYGSTFYETPNLDGLASQGARFTDSYAACPVCSPTRAALMTGQYPARVGVTNYIPGKTHGRLLPAPFLEHLPLETPNLARTLRDNGYATWHFGKWHLGTKRYGPERRGFDVVVGTNSNGKGKRSNFSPFNLENLEDGTAEFITDALADRAIRLISENRDKPFFLNFWSYAPHVPIAAPAELVDKYKAKAKRLGLDQHQALQKGEPFPVEQKKDQRVARRFVQADPTYAGMVENLDAAVGRILKAIDDAGQTDNTIVVFTSDNGGLSTAEGSPTANLPFNQGKGWMYEGGIRVPLITRWPGTIAAGTISRTPVTTPDLLPTLLHAAGIAPSNDVPLDGANLMPVLTDSAPLQRDAIYWHYPHYGNQGGSPAAAVRSGDWKLIQFFDGERFELYNLKDDIGEKKDLANKHPEVVEKLKKQLKAWQQDVGAKFPTPNPAYQPS